MLLNLSSLTKASVLSNSSSFNLLSLRSIVFSMSSQNYSSASAAAAAIKVVPNIEEKFKAEVLTSDGLEFLKKLHLNFEPRRQELLAQRIVRQKELESGNKPLKFLDSTKSIRDDPNWKVAPLPLPLQKRHVEITGPVDRKMVINALNSGSDCYMADFEDSNTPTWLNQLNGQINLKDAIRRRIDFEVNGKQYKLKPKVATLLVRPRGIYITN